MIRLCVPDFDAQDLARVKAVMDSGQLVQGPTVAAFERAVSEYLGVEAVACSNGTAALHLSVMALGLGPGDEVIVPAFTWPSAAHVIAVAGATPVFVDIDRETLNLDASQLEGCLTERTRAILPIHQFGIPAPMGEVLRVARERGLRVIEDAACAIGTVVEGQLAGTLSDLGCFSLHPRKIITTGEGGLVVGRNAALMREVRSLRNHGQNPDEPLYRFNLFGLNYRMPEMCAALGLGQMERLPDILSRRRLLGARYVTRLALVDGVRVPKIYHDPANNYQVLAVDVGAAHRAEVMAELRARGVETAIGTYAVTSQPIYRETFGIRETDFPRAHEAMMSLVSLPLHPGMSESDVDFVCEQLALVMHGRGNQPPIVH